MSDLSMLLGLMPAPPKLNQPQRARKDALERYTPGQMIGGMQLIGRTHAPDSVHSPAAQKRAYWICKCQCGRTFVRREDYIRNGSKNPTCCRQCPNVCKSPRARRKIADLTGQRFGYLRITGRDYSIKSPYSMWRFVCDCGATGVRRRAELNHRGDYQRCSLKCTVAKLGRPKKNKRRPSASAAQNV